jgi:hypothetical protein
MTEFYLDTDNMSAPCELISGFPNGNFVLVGQNVYGSTCLVAISNTAPINTESLRVFDSATQQAVEYGTVMALPDQVCVFPNATFDPETDTVYNTVNNKLVAKDKRICRTPLACPPPDDLCDATNKAFYIGIGAGAALSLLVVFGCYSKTILNKCRASIL